MGGLPTFANPAANAQVAPLPAVRETAIKPSGSTGDRPSGSREHGGSLLRQASQAQAGGVEFENLWCRKVKVLAKAGDRQLGVDGKHSTEFGACLVEPTEMSIGGDFDPHLCDQVRLVV